MGNCHREAVRYSGSLFYWGVSSCAACLTYGIMKVIMWLVVFMAVCSVPLIVLGFIGIWRIRQWEKYNDKMHPQGVDV